jgi:hypothetical protein
LIIGAVERSRTSDLLITKKLAWVESLSLVATRVGGNGIRPGILDRDDTPALITVERLLRRVQGPVVRAGPFTDHRRMITLNQFGLIDSRHGFTRRGSQLGRLHAARSGARMAEADFEPDPRTGYL